MVQRAQVAMTSEPGLVRTLRDLTWKPWEIEVNTRAKYMESVNLMRIGRAEIEANPDGISLGGLLFDSLAAVGQMSREQIAQPGSTAFNAGVSAYRDMLNGVASYAWVVTAGNSRADQINAGAAYVRLNLRAALQGIAAHPVSQALQEFPEMAEPYRNVHAALDVASPNTLQMLARIGYGPEVDPAPRWPLEAKLENA
ncbi:MAG: hypothetical protein NW215_14810 [Hyphomicrobiales bacterium]|nr:hypothetical protein [Hyphomicrobiales bacterium]